MSTLSMTHTIFQDRGRQPPVLGLVRKAFVTGQHRKNEFLSETKQNVVVKRHFL